MRPALMTKRHQVSPSHKLAGLAAGPRVIDLVLAMIHLTRAQGQGIIATHRPKLDTLNLSGWLGDSITCYSLPVKPEPEPAPNILV